MAEDSPEQQKLRKEMEDKEVSEVAADDMGNLLYYAGIVVIGFIIMMIIKSPTFQALMASLGKLFGAAVDLLSFLADNPWLLLLLAFAKPLFKVLSGLAKRLGSLETVRQSWKIDRLFKDPAFRGRNEGFARKVRAEYSTFNAAQKTQMSDSLKSMDQKFDRTAAMKKIDADPNTKNKSVMEKIDLLSQIEVDFQKQIGTRAFGSLNGLGGPDAKKVDNLLIQGLINSAQNGLDAMRIGNPLSAIDANNILRASDVVDKVSVELKQVYGVEEFEKIKANIKQSKELLEARIRLTNRIVFLNNTNSLADGVKLDPDKILALAKKRVDDALLKMENGMSLPEADRNQMLLDEMRNITNNELDVDNNSKWTGGGDAADINAKTGEPMRVFGMPDGYGEYKKPKGLFGSSSTPGTFGKLPTISPPRLGKR